MPEGRGRRPRQGGFGALRSRLGSEPRPPARRSTSAVPAETHATLLDGTTKMAFDLVVGEVLVVGPGEMIASDGTVIDGVAMVEESTITGESAPVIREAGTERNVVTGGTHVVSGRLTIEIT